MNRGGERGSRRSLQGGARHPRASPPPGRTDRPGISPGPGLAHREPTDSQPSVRKTPAARPAREEVQRGGKEVDLQIRCRRTPRESWHHDQLQPTPRRPHGRGRRPTSANVPAAQAPPPLHTRSPPRRPDSLHHETKQQRPRRRFHRRPRGQGRQLPPTTAGSGGREGGGARRETLVAPESPREATRGTGRSEIGRAHV